MAENNKLILDKFIEHLDTDYKMFCDRHYLEPATFSLVTFLIDKNLIPRANIKRYTVLQEFEELIEEKANHKTKTIHALSDKFNIPERTIWGILKKEKTKLGTL